MIYRSAPRELEPLRVPRAPLWRRAKASLRGLPRRLQVRQAWLVLPVEVRLVLREAGLRRELLDLASAELLTQATERVAAAWRYERAVEAYRARILMQRAEPKKEVLRADDLSFAWRPEPRPLPDPPANLKPHPVPLIGHAKPGTDMQRAVACSATSVPEAVEALREGLLTYVLMQVVRGR